MKRSISPPKAPSSGKKSKTSSSAVTTANSTTKQSAEEQRRRAFEWAQQNLSPSKASTAPKKSTGRAVKSLQIEPSPAMKKDEPEEEAVAEPVSVIKGKNKSRRPKLVDAVPKRNESPVMAKLTPVSSVISSTKNTSDRGRKVSKASDDTIDRLVASKTELISSPAQNQLTNKSAFVNEVSYEMPKHIMADPITEIVEKSEKNVVVKSRLAHLTQDKESSTLSQLRGLLILITICFLGGITYSHKDLGVAMTSVAVIVSIFRRLGLKLAKSSDAYE